MEDNGNADIPLLYKIAPQKSDFHERLRNFA